MNEPDIEDETISTEEMKDSLAELREDIQHLEDNPSDLLAIGVVVAYTDETTKVCSCEGHDHVSDGMVLRMVNPTAHTGYRELGSLLEDVHTFDEQCDDIKLSSPDVEAQAMPVGLGDLLGGDGPF